MNAEDLRALGEAMRLTGISFNEAAQAAAKLGQSFRAIAPLAVLADRSMREERQKKELEALARIIDGEDDRHAEQEGGIEDDRRSIRLPD